MAEQTAEIARVFELYARLSELLGENKFKTIAYQKAARVLGEFAGDVGAMSEAELRGIEGIGKGVADRVIEWVQTGRIAELDALVEQVPAGVLDIMDIPGVGPKTAALFWREAGVDSIVTLKAALHDGRLTALKGFGEKKLANIEKNLAFAQSAGDRQRIGHAYDLAQRLMRPLREIKGVQRVEYAGSLRRGRESIGDIDVLVSCKAEVSGAVLDAFVKHEAVVDVIAHGPTKASVRTDASMQADLRVVLPEQFGAAWMYFTGSKEHNVALRERAQKRGLTLNEYGLMQDSSTPGAGQPRALAGETEEGVYAALGLPWVPPELREDRGELAMAERGELPALVELGDIVAELHTHTTASDGSWSIEDNVRGAVARGFHTVAITDHSKSQFQANGLSNDRLVQHIEAVRRVAKQFKGTITVLAGSEVDILSDGSLDYPDELLAELDIVVASPHAALSQEPDKATARLLRAIENPYVTILGHPTGRLVMRREGLSPDIVALCKSATQRGIALEINANHYRLDLRDTHARLALEHGCKLAINTDAHGPADLDQLRFGVLTARRAGARKGDIINAMDPASLLGWLKGTREKR